MIRTALGIVGATFGSAAGMAATLAVAFQSAPGSGPFFSNDFAGAVKVVLVFGGTIAGVATFFYKFTHGKVEQDVVGIGKKLDDHVKATSDATAGLTGRMTAVERDAGRCVNDIGHLREGHGELKRALETLEKSGVELHRDITTMLTASQGALTAQINQVQVQLAAMQARIDERDKLAAMLERVERGRGNGAGGV